MSVPSVRQSMPKFRCNSCLSVQKMFEPMTAGSINHRAPAAKQYFTSCFHVLCNSCRFKNLQNCALCNRNCQFMGCNNNMSKQYQHYFKPISYAKKQFMTVMKFQRTQNNIGKRRMASKMVYIEKKRSMVMKKVEVNNQLYQQAKEVFNKLKAAHQTICQEKRRRSEEKQQGQQQQQPQHQRQQPTENQSHQQQQQHYQQSQYRLPEHQHQQQRQHLNQRFGETRHEHQPAYASRQHHQFGHSNNHQHHQQNRNELNTVSSVSSTSDITVPSSFGMGS